MADINIMEDQKTLEFLAVNSKESIEKQVDSYRQQHSYAGTIIGAIALFIPFFLGSFDGTSLVIQYISIIPIAFFIYSILLMLSIFRTKPLDQAFNVTKYKKLLPKTYKEVLLFEIEANTRSYTINEAITSKGNRRYSVGVRLTIIALLASIVLILVNKFIGIEKAPVKVKVVNSSKLSPSFSSGLFAVHDAQADQHVQSIAALFGTCKTNYYGNR
jgi:hypothetical protein